MNELILNLHMHTVYSDGSGTHADLGRAALKSGLDVILVTDHNILVKGTDAYLRDGKKRVLILTGEEIHDQDRDPQKNHLLVFGVDDELATLADDPQSLIDAVHTSGGICFLAHPVDPALDEFGETDISWEDWGIGGYTGIELWNGYSELKMVTKGKWNAVAYAFFPEFIPHGPDPDLLRRWDILTREGRRVVAIGGSDAHAQHRSLGFLHKTIFPYEYHFSTINTHLLAPEPLTGDLPHDRTMVFTELSKGHCFIGYDLPARTRGFCYSAKSKECSIIMGDEIFSKSMVTLQAKFPEPAEIYLINNGRVVKTMVGDTLLHFTDEPGAYRVEAYKNYLGKKRGWIFSNPIYIK
jgi:hypothetical protein